MADRRPTRSQLLGSLVFEAVLQARLTWREYAAGVVEHYHATVLAEDRAIEFQIASTSEQYEGVIRNNTQVVRRILSGERHMLSDIEESLLAPLPDAFRERVLCALLDRKGLLLARKPAAADDMVGQVRCTTDLMRRAAAAVDSIAPMLQDQRIGPEDAPHFAPALQAINGVMGACITLNAQIANAMGQVPAGQFAPQRSRDVH